MRSWIGLVLLVGCSYKAPASVPEDGVPPDDTSIPLDILPDIPTSVRAGTPIAEWRFTDSTSGTIADVIAESPLPLTLSANPVVTQVSSGLHFDARSNATSAVQPHVNRDIRASGALTLEVWVTAENATQGSAPGTYALVAGISVSTMLRNLGIEQRGNNWVGRVRTSTSSLNADPPVAALATVDPTHPTHLALVSDGVARTLYVDGVAFTTMPEGGGTTTNWDTNYRIRIGDESGANRAWLGTFWFLAFYDRALTSDEVQQNFVAGHDCDDC